MELTTTEILRRFPLRIAVSDFCNLRCFFCSNEGMELAQKNTTHMDVAGFEYLITVAARHGLRQISITGGEPTLHPDLHQILTIVNASGVEIAFFHTNGVGLTRELVSGPLMKFAKIAISIHAMDYSTWHVITGGTKDEFARLLDNIRMLGETGYGPRLELKQIPIRGINDSPEAIRGLLGLCVQYGAMFKFLVLEPIEQVHMKLVVSLSELAAILEQIGCKPMPQQEAFRGQSTYLPVNEYQYHGARCVAIEIACGRPDVCQSCYEANEVFVTPAFELKPCHISPYAIPLKEIVSSRQEAQLLDAFVESREFLRGRPGESAQYWLQNQEMANERNTANKQERSDHLREVA